VYGGLGRKRVWGGCKRRVYGEGGVVRGGEGEGVAREERSIGGLEGGVRGKRGVMGLGFRV
jgi:hypothetical protein